MTSIQNGLIAAFFDLENHHIVSSGTRLILFAVYAAAKRRIAHGWRAIALPSRGGRSCGFLNARVIGFCDVVRQRKGDFCDHRRSYATYPFALVVEHVFLAFGVLKLDFAQRF